MNITTRAYAPITEAKDEIENSHTSIQEETDHTRKQDILTKAESKVERFRLGARNEARDWPVDFCKTNNLSITSTGFKQLKRRLYTWPSEMVNTEMTD